MPIDIRAEHVITLREACELIPRRRAGKKAAIETLYRWTVRGCRGVRLETIQIGGTRGTSREALQRFFDALTAASPGYSPATSAEPQKVRFEAIERAKAACNAAGI